MLSNCRGDSKDQLEQRPDASRKQSSYGAPDGKVHAGVSSVREDIQRELSHFRLEAGADANGVPGFYRSEQDPRRRIAGYLGMRWQTSNPVATSDEPVTSGFWVLSDRGYLSPPPSI
jgi:hypothetical protein